uniref:Replication factor C subunit 4 n=1 Tax=Aceria tosichella TaxID=561515 RepID=A0A6G1SEY5_9ACAR
MIQPWVEKYRPATLDDVVHHNEVVAVLKQTLVSNDFPNLLLYGPPGTGKTSSIMALAKAMFGSRMDQRVLHLNASDERGISVIRERVRRFAQSVPMNFSGDVNTQQKQKKIVRLKLIILDEADSMTSSAQACLRRTMEIYSKTTRFCLICNYVSRIIEPIASRCSKFRFQSITEPILRERLEFICKSENVTCSDPKVLEHLISVCDGDLRQAITVLQSAHRLAGPDKQIDLDLIHEVCGYIPRRYINKFVAACKSKSLDRLDEYITSLINEGYTASQFLSQIHDWLLTQSNLSDNSLAKILPALALAEHRFCDGSDEYIQLMYVASVVAKNQE